MNREEELEIAIKTALTYPLPESLENFLYSVLQRPKEEPVRLPDGSLHQLMIRLDGPGKPCFRCECGCNVFHKPDKNKPNIYKCNCCENRYHGE